ncbi:MAG: SpoIVB peptidase, partial [Oscillospiraceae bacterium]
RYFTALLSAAVMILLICALYLQSTLPSHFDVEKGDNLSLERYSEYLSCNLSSDEFPIGVYKASGNTYKMDINFMGIVAVKEVNVQVVDRRTVVAGGIPFGIKMFTDGVMVVGIGDVEVKGELESPAQEAGIEIGDIVVEMNGRTTLTNKDVLSIVSQSEGKPIKVTVKRDGYLRHLLLEPEKNATDGIYRIGLWVRDSSAGIGTMTFYDADTLAFAGLGHAICDVDTQDIMPLYEGEVVNASITGIKKGCSGSPGELKGVFAPGENMGELTVNNATGVYGVLSEFPKCGQEMAVAFSYEVTTGPATILTTVNGSEPQEYEIYVERINYSDAEPTKNMIIRVTDSKLIEQTGGIVQGMSGSPIIQNGRLIGAVTHVFVNEPTKGFGIFAENMDKTLQTVAISNTSAA